MMIVCIFSCSSFCGIVLIDRLYWPAVSDGVFAVVCLHRFGHVIWKGLILKTRLFNELNLGRSAFLLLFLSYDRLFVIIFGFCILFVIVICYHFCYFSALFSAFFLLILLCLYFCVWQLEQRWGITTPCTRWRLQGNVNKPSLSFLHLRLWRCFVLFFTGWTIDCLNKCWVLAWYVSRDNEAPRSVFYLFICVTTTLKGGSWWW